MSPTSLNTKYLVNVGWDFQVFLLYLLRFCGVFAGFVAWNQQGT